MTPGEMPSAENVVPCKGSDVMTVFARPFPRFFLEYSIFLLSHSSSNEIGSVSLFGLWEFHEGVRMKRRSQTSP
jgi:hypothetical protein